MSDRVGNPEEKFSRVSAHWSLKESKKKICFPFLLRLCDANSFRDKLRIMLSACLV